jgi:hypothetical protein
MANPSLPFVNFPAASVCTIEPVNGYAYITEATTNGRTTKAAIACIQVQCTAPFTVEVVGPMGSFMNDPPHSPYPGPGPAAGGANEIVIIRGRWHSLRVATTGTVYVMFDHDFRANGGT